MLKLPPRLRLAAGRLLAKNRAPYYRAAILGLIPVEAPGLGTMGVTDKAVMLWDPEACEKMNWTEEEIAGALIHEVEHLRRGHIKRGYAMGIDPAKNPELSMLWNIATDAELGDDLEHAGWKTFARDSTALPTNTMYFNPAAKEGLTAEAYYHILRKDLEKALKSAPQHPACAAGFCGSAGGRPLPQEPKRAPQGPPAEPGQAQQPPAEQPPGQGDGDLQGRSDAEMNRMWKQVARDIKAEAAKGRGNVPEHLNRWADETLQEPKVHWTEYLNSSIRDSLSQKIGAVNYTYKRMSRRQAAVGYGPGRPIMPALYAPVPTVQVWVDTSGSMGNSELRRALSETAGIMETTGAEVLFGAIDCAVQQEVKAVSHWEELIPLLNGGGGTDFCPAFQYMETQEAKPDLVVFITDGDGAAPKKAPEGVEVVWVLVGPHRRRPCTWGIQLEIDEDGRSCLNDDIE